MELLISTIGFILFKIGAYGCLLYCLHEKIATNSQEAFVRWIYLIDLIITIGYLVSRYNRITGG